MVFVKEEEESEEGNEELENLEEELMANLGWLDEVYPKEETELCVARTCRLQSI